ncbi:hypothetical protein HYC85_028667 [Camellia sinensis]|uniref:Uncharacterized protein n=1 Tax=Camellia sinensis TaxID=4442 RepID=A0A7J7FZS6_CAMSI|nr:hypothetical protein HYC85_028667 [Camellia sinensis]
MKMSQLDIDRIAKLNKPINTDETIRLKKVAAKLQDKVEYVSQRWESGLL